MNQQRTIKVPPGIGDTLWLIQKLINTGEKFYFAMPGGKPRRGKQVFDLLPMIGEGYYDTDLYYQYVKAYNVQGTKNKWSEINEHEFHLTANEWLEAGHHISEFLYDLPTSYKLPFQTDEWRVEVMEDFVDYGPELIGIYGSTYSTQREWGFWGAQQWWELIKPLHDQRPEAVFAIIGAEWDSSFCSDLMAILKSHGVRYLDTVGRPLGYVIELMKVLRYGYYFPSGLGIISGLQGHASIMFYPPHLRPMQGKWKEPDNSDLIETQFTAPGEVYKMTNKFL
jgi:hypothetical protein